MRKRIAVAVASVALLGAPAAQGAISGAGAQRPFDFRSYETRYLELRSEYVKRFGVAQAGRDIVSDGYRAKDGAVRQATKAEVVASANRMDAALHPAPVSDPAATSAATATTTSYSTTSASSSTIACESGGNYSADTGNGYYGAYQFDQSTWNTYAPAGYAGTNPAAAPPSVQDAAAASVPYDAWPSCP